MTESSPAPAEEISLLDFLVVIAESWALLLFVPIIAGLLVFGLLRLQPQSYSSTVTLLVRSGAAWSPGVTNAVPDVTMQSALGRLASAGVEINPAKLAAAFSPPQLPGGWGTQSFTLTGGDGTTLRSSLAALAHEIDAQLEAAATAASASQIAIVDDGIASRRAALAQLQDRMKELTGADAQTWATAVDALVSDIGVQSARKLELQEAAAVQPASFILTQATPAHLAPGRDPLLLGIVAAFGAGFVTLVIVFARAGIRRKAIDPERNEKLARIRRAFWLGPRRQGEQAKS